MSLTNLILQLNRRGVKIKLKGTMIGCQVSRSSLDPNANAPEIADLSQLLAVHHRDDVVRHLVYLLQIIELKRSELLAIQMDLAKQYLVRDRLIQFSNISSGGKGNWVLFHSRALWFVLQFAVVTCRIEKKESSGDVYREASVRYAIGEMLLLANEFLDGDKEIEGPVDDDKITSLLGPIMELSSDHSDIFGMARYQSLWREIPNGERYAKSNPTLEVSWDEAFERRFGISIHNFGLIATVIFAFFQNANIEQGPLKLIVDSHFGDKAFRRYADIALKMLAQTQNELATTLIRSPKQSWTQDFSCLKSKPLIWIGPGEIACPQLSFLQQRLCDGLFWDLVEAYKDTAHSFRDVFGTAFEIYVESLFDSFSHAGDYLHRDRFASPKFESSTHEFCDLLVDWSEVVLIVECKSGFLTTRQKFGGFPEELLQGVDTRIGSVEKGVGQFAKSLPKFLDGGSVFCDGIKLKLNPTCKFIPMIIVNEQIFAMHANRQRVQRKLDSLIDSKVADRMLPLVILDLKDVELLQGISDDDRAITAKQVLLAYVEHLSSNPNDSLGSFQSFVFDKYENARASHDSEMRRVAHRALEEAKMEVEKLLLSEVKKIPFETPASPS